MFSYRFNKIFKNITNGSLECALLLMNNYNKFTPQQKIKLMKCLHTDEAYSIIKYFNYKTEYESMILTTRLLNGKQHHGLMTWQYIKILMEGRAQLTPYMISKFTDYLIENEVLEYIPRFYEIIITNRDPNYCNNELWINYDCPRIEPYVLITKLI